MTSTSNLPQSLSKGYCFIGKYIGDELVPDARGNHVCRPAMDSIIRKAGYKGSSKKRISILVSSAGLKIFNGTTGYVLFDLPASKISFVYNSSYAPDFGVVFTESEKDFVFFGMRIDSNSDQVVLKCREMLEFVCQMKQMQIEQMKKERGLAAPDLITWNPPETKQDADKFSTVPTSSNSLRESTSSDPSAAQQPTSEARLAVQRRNNKTEQEQRAPPRYPFGEGFFRSQ